MKALIIYGSRWGGTVGVAEKIGEGLTKEGYQVDVVDAKKSPKTLDSYDLFVVGSGIRNNKWTNEAINFLQKNAKLLQQKKTALFVSCQMADRQETDPLRIQSKKQYLDDTAEQYGLKPIIFGFFGGFLDFHKSHGLIVDVMVLVNRKSLKRDGLDTRKIYDTRDWGNIEVWASQLAAVASK
jgi:menaquinone-dependent protoporphyrinogen oxidase